MKKNVIIILIATSFFSESVRAQLLDKCDDLSSKSLGSIYNITKSFTGSDCWKPKKQIPRVPSLKTDLEVCGCLNSSFNAFFTTSDSKTEDIKISEKDVKKTVQESTDQYALEQQLLAHQALIISKGNDQFASEVLSNTPSVKPVGNSKGESVLDVDGCAKGVCAYNKATSKEDKKNTEKFVQNAMSEIKVSDSSNTEIFSDKITYPGEQCITATEYVALNQLPRSDRIKDLVQKTNLDNFFSDEWNYKKLEKEYDQIMMLPAQEKWSKRTRLLEIKEKLKYLNNNQILKTFMAADPDLRDLKSNNSIPSDRKKNIQSLWEKNVASIEEKKKELFKIIRDLSELKSSSSSESNLIPFYQEKIKSFFVGENFDLLMNENVRQAHYRINSNIKRKLKKTPVTYKLFTDKFLLQSKLGNPADCFGPSLDETKCSRIFSEYCPALKAMKGSIMREEDSDLADDLHEILSRNSNLDMKSNPDFKLFNDLVCNTKHSKSTSDRTQPVTFFEYLKKNCPDCVNNPTELSKWRSRFTKEYPVSLDNRSYGLESQISALEDVSKGIPRGKRNVFKNSAFALSDNASFSQLLLGSTSSRASIDSLSDISKDKSLAPSASGSFSDLPAKDAGNISGFGHSNYTAPLSAEPKKVEDMSADERKSYLSKLEREYEKKLRDLEKKSTKSDESSIPDSAKEISALKNEIDTWKALLAQQQNITSQQMKMLNESINARAKQEALAAEASKKKNPSESSIFSNPQRTNPVSRDGDNDITRSNLSAKDQGGFDRSSTTRGPASGPRNSSTAGASSVTSTSSAAASSSDSVAREQAKLNAQPGTIMIETPKGQGQDIFSLPVSSEQYQNLKADPTQVSLDPKQVELLNQKGMITIIVGAVGKPPLELKVEKVDNKIVYNLKEQDGPKRAPASRVFTREALELQFQTPR